MRRRKRKAWRWRLPEDGIRPSPPIPRPGGAFSVVGGCVDVCLQRIARDSVGIGLCWISVDPVFVRVPSRVYMLDPSNLRFSSSSMIVVLVPWSRGVLA